MADSSRHAADFPGIPTANRRLAACLAISGLLHALVLVPMWSSLGGFRLTGSSAQRPSFNRPLARLDAVIRSMPFPETASSPPVATNPVREVRPPTGDPAISRVARSADDAVAPPSADHNAAEESAPDQSNSGEPARSAPLPKYFAADDLTRQPELVDDLDETLREPLEAGFRGRLVLRLFLNEAGKVDSVRVITSTMPVDVEGLVVKTFFLARYRAGEIDGLPVMSEMTVEVGVSAYDAFGPLPPAGADRARPSGPR